jgi:hypothetical protein
LPEVREYFGDDLLASHPGATLFWEHGGYLTSLVDRCRRTIVDCDPNSVFHIGDMTGSIVKATHHPDAPDVSRRVSRAAAIQQFIQRTLQTHYPTDRDFLLACDAVVTFAQRHDLAVLQKLRA